MKKTPPDVVTDDLPPPPGELSTTSATLWRTVVAEREMSAAELALFAESLHALDEAATARKQLSLDGLTVHHGTGGLKAHPLCDVEARARQFFAASVRQLGLHLEEDTSPVPRAKPGPKPRVAPARGAQ
ncbi:MAG TPA: hypothetical protein PK020_13140 [Ilumatobacteraceae bacterium]|nr:hypothetical protein [Ilumatobacteraceae bacterium]